MRLLSSVLCALLVMALVTGCAKKPNFNAPLPPGAKALRKITPDKYPQFVVSLADLPQVNQAVEHSIRYMNQPSSRKFYPYLDITHERGLASLHAFKQLIQLQSSANAGREQISLNADITRYFDVYQSYGAPDPNGSGYTDRVLFTGYFTPIYEASLTPDSRFRWPLYRRPADLVTSEVDETAGRKMPDGSLQPYYTREQIEKGALKGLEFVYLSSRWDAYVITVQGSARLRLADGRIYEIGFAGVNGYEYTSPGMKMLADGVINEDQLSLKGLREFYQANPVLMDKYLWMNQRYVFFTERPGGPFGCLNVPVTQLASIATDKSVYPRAMPAFLQVLIPTASSGESRDFSGFMMDQDAGGAIRAAGRCDIFMGIGEDAERRAGHQLNEGKLYYIAVKDEYISRWLPRQVALLSARPFFR